VASLPAVGYLQGPITCPAVINRSAPAAAGVRRFRGAKRGGRIPAIVATGG
jgi:hypothetical protein